MGLFDTHNHKRGKNIFIILCTQNQKIDVYFFEGYDKANENKNMTSSDVRAGDCGSKGPWFKSHQASSLTIGKIQPC